MKGEILSLLAILLFSSFAFGQKCYVTLYAYEGGTLNRAVDSHTFVDFHCDGEHHTISWLPATLRIRILSNSEKGVNLTLMQTIGLATVRRYKVYKYGPYLVHPKFYEYAINQERRLKLGKIKYKCVSGKEDEMNCIKAVISIIENDELETGLYYGSEATIMIKDHWKAKGWIVGKK